MFQYIPKICGALLLLAIAWGIASIIKAGLKKLLSAKEVDKRLGAGVAVEGEKPILVSQTLSDAAYWLVFLLFIPLILEALGFEGGLMDPIQKMFSRVFEYIPNIAAAGVILVAGWAAARIISRITANLINAAGAENFASKIGLSAVVGDKKLSKIAGVIVYALIIIPTVTVALETLKIEAITRPMTNMLNKILEAVPQVCARP